MFHKIKNKYKQHKLERRRQLDMIKNMPSAYDDAIISWIAPETIRHQHGPIWKTVMSFLVAGAIILGIYYDAWTFSLVVAVFVITYYLVHLEHPKSLEVKISDIGTKIGYRKYTYSQIKAFWIIYDPPYVQTLNIRVIGEYVSDITIQLNTQSPATVREFLMAKIPEMEGQSEKLSDIFLRLFKI